MAREQIEVIETAQLASHDGAPIPDLASYDHIIVAFSGGKDSLALLLYLLELGVPKEKITCHHHLVDGREGSTLMDWPVTEAYCAAMCRALGVRLEFSWREGGFEREMLRQDAPTAPAWVPSPQAGFMQIGGKGPADTRLKFPQQSASLSCRWCSSVLKIDVFDRYLKNHPQFIGRRTLVLTGERAEESTARAQYEAFESHRADTRSSTRVPRHIDVWRAVHGWSEQQVWEIIARWKIVPHPAYMLGWGRCSCRQCVFGSKHQWATIRLIAPEQFKAIAAHERRFGLTIHRKFSVEQQADSGIPYDVDPKWVAIANSTEFNHPVFLDDWTLPPGAFGESAGPT